MENNNRYLFWAIPLIILSCIEFHYNTESLQINYVGAAVFFLIIGISSLVMLFNCLTYFEEYLVNRKILKTKLNHNYQALLPPAIFLMIISYSASGNMIKDMHGQSSHEWVFKLGQSEYKVYQIIALVLFFALIRIFKIIRAASIQSKKY